MAAVTYQIVVSREGSNWLGSVKGLPGADTFGRSLPGLIRSVRESIILMADLADDAKVEVELFIENEDDNVSTLAEAAQLGRERREILRREADLHARTAVVAKVLTGEGYSVRDTGALLDLTPGRVSQLTSA